MSGIICIFCALLLLIYLAYRGISVLLLAPLLAALAVLFSQDTPVLASYTQVFMKALGGFIVLYFPLFLLGAPFGKLMEASGAAHTIAHRIVDWLGRRHAVLAIVLACAVLTYGGVALFVVAFAVYPIAAALFRQTDVPKRLIPASIAPGNPLISLTIAVNVLAGITGSASGGMSIALQTLGSTYRNLARSADISPALLHRVTAIATGGLDSLPHNGAVVTLLSICKLSHRVAYPDLFMVVVIGPIVALVVVIGLGTWLGAF